MPTPFPPNKTAEELGIDTSREFVVVKPGLFARGEKLLFEAYVGGNRLKGCFRSKETGESWSVYWENLAYADEPEPEAYVPQVGDRVSLEGKIDEVENGHVKVNVTNDEVGVVWFAKEEVQKLKLLSRPKPKRRVTMKEVEEAFGEAVEIISE